MSNILGTDDQPSWYSSTLALRMIVMMGDPALDMTFVGAVKSVWAPLVSPVTLWKNWKLELVPRDGICIHRLTGETEQSTRCSSKVGAVVSRTNSLTCIGTPW